MQPRQIYCSVVFSRYGRPEYVALFQCICYLYKRFGHLTDPFYLCVIWYVHQVFFPESSVERMNWFKVFGFSVRSSFPSVWRLICVYMNGICESRRQAWNVAINQIISMSIFFCISAGMMPGDLKGCKLLKAHLIYSSVIVCHIWHIE